MTTGIMSASQVLSAFWNGSLPVNPDVIASRMGVRVCAMSEEDRARGLSGQIEVIDGQPVASINLTEAPVRQRFTVAHELGHFTLGHLANGEILLRDPAANFSSGYVPPQERAANAFAAELLMPENVLRFAVVEKKVRDIVSLARLFNVSQVAMRYRLQNIGLIRG